MEIETIPAPTVLVTDLGTSQTLPSTTTWSEGSHGAPEPAQALAAPLSPITCDGVSLISEEPPDWGGDSEDEDRMAELPVSETMPAPTPKKEDQDHELQQMSPTPRMLEQATAYLEAQGSKAGNVTATDLGADTPPLCLAVANCSVNVTPVNSVPPTPAWTPCQTPAQSSSPRSDPCGSAGDEVEQGQMLTSGIRKLPDSSTVVLEPLWFQAGSIIWLLDVRKQVQDDSSFLNARGPH